MINHIKNTKRNLQNFYLMEKDVFNLKMMNNKLYYVYKNKISKPQFKKFIPIYQANVKIKINHLINKNNLK